MSLEIADDIIKAAYDKIGLLPEDGNLSGGKSQKGLDLLNAQLKQYESDQDLIAYDSDLSFPLIIGQNEYKISSNTSLSPDVVANKIVRLKFVNLIVNDIQYPVNIVEDHVWFRKVQNLSLTGRPFDVYLQNEPEASNLIFLRKPEQIYICNIKAKFNLSDLDFSSNLTSVPQDYKMFLIYELARLLVDNFPGTNWSDLSESIYERYKANIISSTDKNMTAVTSSVLNYPQSGYGYGEYGIYG